MHSVPTRQQQVVLDLLAQHKSVFVHGDAGSGKSVLADLIGDTFPNAIVTTACTQRSPSAFDVTWWAGIYKERSMSDVRIRNCEMLVIDDCQFLSVEEFLLMNDKVQCIREDDSFFGGVTVALIGDVWQTPRNTELLTDTAMACFQHTVLLNRAKDDPELSDLLEEVRKGNLDTIPMKPERVPTKKEITLLTAADACYMNETIITRLIQEGCKPHVFVASTLCKGHAVSLRGIEEIDHCMFHDKTILTLCVGCRVMLTIDYHEADLKEGACGTVVAFNEHDGLPIVHFDCGVEIVIQEYSFSIPRYPKLERVHIPLMLAWAAPIEWVPSFSLVSAVIPTTKIDSETIYSALSRCKTLDGVTIMGPRVRPTGRTRVLADMYKELHQLDI